MALIEANGIRLDYEATGSVDAPPLVLIRGLGTQHILWPPELLSGLADRGLRVVVFDNRDVGLSTKLDAAGAPDVAAAMAKAAAGQPIDAPYTVDDMALDTVGLLDALGIDSAHVAGISMGGMIAQVVAARHAARVRSVASIMSSSGNRDLPQATPEAARALVSRPDGDDRESVVRNAMEVQRTIGSPGYPSSDEYLRRQAERAYDRCYCPEGVARQLVGVLASGSRLDLLPKIAAPALVIHGADDPLVPVEAGRDTAQRIPGARLEIIPGMGHDVAPGLVPRLVELIAGHALAAEEARR